MIWVRKQLTWIQINIGVVVVGYLAIHLISPSGSMALSPVALLKAVFKVHGLR